MRRSTPFSRSAALAAAAAIAATACSGSAKSAGNSALVRGIVYLVRGRTAVGAPLDVSAFFWKDPVRVDLGGDPPIGSCGKLAPSPRVATTPLLVGSAMTVGGPAGTLVLPATGAGEFIAVLSSTQMWVPDGGYVFGVGGHGAIAPFAVGAAAPSDLTLEAPSIASTVTIDRASDLVIAWTSTGGADPVYVTIDQTDSSDNRELGGVVCLFPDSGAATVPSAALGVLLDGATHPTVLTAIGVQKQRVLLDDVPDFGNVELDLIASWGAKADVQ